MSHRVPILIEGLIFLVIGIAMIAGCRAVGRAMAMRDRSAAIYTLYDFVGASIEHPWALSLGAVLFGLVLALLGFYIAWNALAA